jgi:hypothetical protein
MSQIRTLQTWKEIAGYIGRGVRTVQRWEDLGLPVRRPQTDSPKSAVYIITHELDTWLLNNSGGRCAHQVACSDIPNLSRNGYGDLEQVLITHKLSSRPLLQRDKAAQIRALKAIADEVTSPGYRVLGVLVDHALELCGAGSAGLSLLHKEDREKQFHWDAMAGVLRDCVGQTTPRDLSPCGVTLERRSPQLFSYPARYFSCLKESPVPLVEGLVIPIFIDGKGVGTIWIVSHDESSQFNSEDVFVMTSLATFCESALSYMTRYSDD